MKKKRTLTARAAKPAGRFSMKIESGCVVIGVHRGAVRIRVFESARAAVAAGLSRGDHLAYGGGRSRGGVKLGEYVPPPAGACENIDCYLEFNGSTADDIEYYVKGKCKEPCACELWVHDKFDSPWYSKGHNGRAKLKDYAGYAAVCTKAG